MAPSGALAYSVDGAEIEPTLPLEISVIADGPLWLTGGIPVRRADGEPFETRKPGHPVPLRSFRQQATLRRIPQESRVYRLMGWDR